MRSLILLLFVTGLTLTGDYFLKSAAMRYEKPSSVLFWVGLILYGLPAFGWFYLMKSHSLAQIGVLYSSVTVVALALVGLLVFKEQIGIREFLGMGLAIVAIWLVSYQPDTRPIGS